MYSRDVARRLDRHVRRVRRRGPEVARSREQARRQGQRLASIPVTLLRGVAPSTKARGSERRPAGAGARRRGSTSSSGQDPGDPDLGDEDPDSPPGSRIAERWIRQFRRTPVGSPSQVEVGA